MSGPRLCRVLPLFVLPAIAAAQTPPAFQKLDAELRAAAAGPPAIAIAVAVAQGGRIVWEAGYGMSDARATATTAHTPFAVGSVAKSVTATTLMRLAERRIIDLDAPIGRYLPGEVRVLQGDSLRLTPAALASMTAGIPHVSRHYWSDNAGSAPSAEGLVRTYGMAVFPPGESFHYSNMSFGVLERLIEKAAGRPFNEVVDREVFAPLGMRNSFFASPRQPRKPATRLLASGAVAEGYVFTEPEGGAGLVASAHDLARFGAFHAGAPIGKREFMSPAAFARMHQPVYQPARYALGMFAGDDSFIMDGSVTGGAGIIRVVPSAGLAAVVVTNAVTSNSATYAFIDKIVEAALAAVGQTARPTEMPAFYAQRNYMPSAETMGRWQGDIHHPNGRVPVTLTFAADSVAITAGGQTVRVQPLIDEGRILLRYRGTLEDPASVGTITIRLQPNRGYLAGFIQDRPHARDGLAFPRYVELRRDR